ncbi:MAG: hypothetical protein JNM63_05090 [Spirochaetia bacterium]|nr:hypothetical protein [Spirochaetia bacterium]
MWETSCVMAVNPESVDLGRVDAIRKDPFVSQLQNETDDTLRSIREASAEFGEKFYQPAAAYLAREAVRILGEKTKVEIS